MTKFVFIAVIAVLAFALYSIPSHSADDPSAKAMQNSKDRAATKKKPERAARAPSQPEAPRSIVAPQPPTAQPVSPPPATIVPPEAPKPEVTK